MLETTMNSNIKNIICINEEEMPKLYQELKEMVENMGARLGGGSIFVYEDDTLVHNIGIDWKGRTDYNQYAGRLIKRRHSYMTNLYVNGVEV